MSSNIPDSKVRFFVGDVSIDGIMYLANMKGSDANISESDYKKANTNEIDTDKIEAYFLGNIRVVDLNTKTPKNPIQIKYIGDQVPIRAADFAISPIDGQLYTINAINNKLVRIIVHSDDSSKIGTVQELGTVYPLTDGKLKLKRSDYTDNDDHLDPYYNQTYSVYTYFDMFGNLYFQVNDESVNATYKVDTSYWSKNASAGENDTMAQAQLFSTLDFSTSGDGARCSLAPVGDYPIVKMSDASGIEGSGVDFKVSSDRNITDPTIMECDLNFVTPGADEKDFQNNKIQYSFQLQGKSLDVDNKFTITIPTLDDSKPEDSEKFKISCHSDHLIFVNESDKNATGTIIDNDVNRIDAYDDGTWDATAKKGVLRTKVVNQTFVFVIHQIDSGLELSTNDTKEDMNNTKYRVIEADACETNASKVNFNDPSFNDFNFDDNGEKIIHDENISKGMREAKIQLIWIDKDGTPKSACSSDSFAIRPDHFTIDVDSNGTVKAGNNFKITIKADDNTSTIVSEYSGTEGVNFDIDANETSIPNCHFDKDFNFDGVKMEGGKLDESKKYNEVGRIYLTIREKDGEEFAKIDALDTSSDKRLITPASKNISFVPDHFKVESKIEGAFNTSLNYAIISNHPSSSPTWKIDVTAVNSDGQATKNYNSECVAHSVSIIPDLEYTNRSDLNLTIAEDDNGSFWEPMSSFTISKTSFDSNATATKRLTYNFKRNPFNALKPVDMTFKRVVAKDTTLSDLNGTHSPNKSIRYKYMRTYVQSPIESVGKKDINVRVYYEAYDPESYGRVSKSGDRAWKIVEYDPSIPTMSFGLDYSMSRGVQKDDSSVITDIRRISIKQDDNETISLKAHKLPSNAKVVFTRDDDFKYITDTINSKIYFNPESANWVGKGKQGRTIDNNISSQRKFKRIDW
ncbi:MAG: hypothetical protein DSZ06_02925 [Sulfurospirillum sp.]|nr:MAG: hypothetical protein DSZ06_02925 [Sulfurospirillum sp.]